MFVFVLGVAIGLVVGWNFLPQPEWVKEKIDELRSKLNL
jgi:hypothetical protein